MGWRLQFLLGTWIGLLVAVHGCTPYYPNEPLQTYDPLAGYRTEQLSSNTKNTDSVFVILTFSGGGTRAAALAQGVLMGLRDLELPGSASADPRSLLDEVDGISSVSGGSFTALAYGLWGEDIFGGHFEKRFLRHNVQGDLVRMGLNPINVLAGANNSELAARYYDKHIFKHATYGDLLARGRPMINVNASDMSRQELFQFIQRDFDLLGSDLSRLPVAWAAASSSAFPIVLAPVRYKYFHGDAMEAAVRAQLTAETTQLRPSYHLWASDLVDQGRFEESAEIEMKVEDHQYLYLLDGGIVDNLGITSLFTAFRDGGIRDLLEAGKIDHLVLIIVDAGTAPPSEIERSPTTPGTLASLFTTATSGIHTNTWLLKALIKHILLEAYPHTIQAYRTHAPEHMQGIPPEFRIGWYAADINFGGMEDYDERRHFLNMPTSFALEKEQVDALIAIGQQLVKEDPEIQRLLRNLRSAAQLDSSDGPG